MEIPVSAAVVCAAIFIGGAASGQVPDDKEPVKPGNVRITTRAPEPGKWDLTSAQNGSQRIFRCKPLACPEPAQITFTFGKSPAAKIDPKALARATPRSNCPRNRAPLPPRARS